MGRFDLSRRYYESALALAPGDPRSYANFAGSLDYQGKRAEAAAVRKELAQRLASATKAAEPTPVTAAPIAVAAATVSPPARTLSEPPKVAMAMPGPTLTSVQAPAGSQPSVAPPRQAAPVPVAARSITVALAAPRPVSPPISSVSAGPRLERLSLGEVALVTSAAPLWRAQLVERSPRSATIGFRPLPRQAGVILLNAARSQGLAARARIYLTSRGWSRIAIGDAPQVMRASTIFYPASRRATAVRLANQFGFALRHQRSEAGALTIMLGRDAAADGNLRAGRG
jgi:hypothetical protein